ncbi:hypothetical protein H9635_09995 [Solibacillus sp. A46]|uniref:Pectinesterase n=1 Tax=Solibacillus faecavium TaxID=2762221 RepID=A0ABR8XYP4_9BACL|nr:hypothetical protein [Solibacillus faecavium]MBD8037076.1 hypothetical protein [Solibacillus faecavium]
MAGQTPNFKLVKPAPEQFYDVAVPNGNMDKIDAALKELQENDDLTQIEQDLSELETKVTTHLDEINPHSETKSRTINVGNTREFKTIQSAINSLKKNLGGKVVRIYVDAGTYPEPVTVEGFQFGTLELSSNSGINTEVKIQSVTVRDCEAVIRVYSLSTNFTGLSNFGLTISTSRFVQVTNLITGAYTPVTGSTGISVFHANVMINGCTISAYDVAIYVAANSIVYVAGLGGSNNRTGLSCYGGSTIGKDGNMPGATVTAETTWAGGVIR